MRSVGQSVLIPATIGIGSHKPADVIAAAAAAASYTLLFEDTFTDTDNTPISSKFDGYHVPDQADQDATYHSSFTPGHWYSYYNDVETVGNAAKWNGTNSSVVELDIGLQSDLEVQFSLYTPSGITAIFDFWLRDDSSGEKIRVRFDATDATTTLIVDYVSSSVDLGGGNYNPTFTLDAFNDVAIQVVEDGAAHYLQVYLNDVLIHDGQTLDEDIAAVVNSFGNGALLMAFAHTNYKVDDFKVYDGLVTGQ